MPIFDVFPTSTPILGLPYKPTEVFASDWATGYDRSIVQKFSSDLAQSVDKLVGLLLPVSDSSLGYEKVVEYGALFISSDLAQAYEFVSQYERNFFDTSQAQELAKILLFASDQSLSQDTLFELLAKIVTLDTSVASELRLSPMFKSSLDSTYGLETIIRLVRYFSDSAKGFESFIFELLATEIAQALENVITLQASTKRFDIGSGVETRLSPIPIFTGESSLGSEIVSGRFRPLYDSASGLDKAFWGYLAKDSSKATEKLVEILREISDIGSGVENKLSPIPLRKLDSSVAKDISKIVFKEQLALDSVSTLDKLVFKASSFRDEGLGYELSTITLPTKDLASTLEKVIFRLITTYGHSSGLEKRLSPIPLKRLDVGSGIDYEMLDKDLLEKDASSGLETRILEIPIQLPPESIGLQVTTSTQPDKVNLKANYSKIKLSLDTYIPSVRKAYSKLFKYYVDLKLKLEQIISQAIRKLITYYLTLNLEISDIGYPISNTSELIYEIKLKPTTNVSYFGIFTISKGNVIPIDFDFSKFKSMRYIQFRNERVIASISKKVSDSSLYSSKDILLELSSSLNVNQPYESTPILVSTSEHFRLTSPKVGVSGISKYASVSLVNDLPFMRSVSTYSRDMLYSTKYSSIGFMNTISTIKKDLLTLETPSKILSHISWSTIQKPKVESTSVSKLQYYLKYASSMRTERVHLREKFLEGMIAIIYRVLEAYKRLLDLQAFLPNIRYVKYGDPVYPEDVNLFYDAFELFVKFAETLYNEQFKGDQEVEFYLNRLKEGLQKFKKVMSFDFVRARDRNQVVDLIYRAREFLETVWNKL